MIYKFAIWQGSAWDELGAVEKIGFNNFSERYLGARQFLEHGKD